MTIREIAELAGVSVSTVSKVMNGKDAGISAETRRHVLEIAKEYRYKPYATALNQGARTMLLGVLVQDAAARSSAIAGMAGAARIAGYSLLIQESGGTPDGELKALSILMSHNVDAVLWEPSSEQSRAIGEKLEAAGIAHLPFGGGLADARDIDYEGLGYAATRALIELGHVDIACCAGQQGWQDRFFAGYSRGLFDAGIAYADELRFDGSAESLRSLASNRQISAAVFACYPDAAEFRRMLGSLQRSIPRDFSVVSLKDDRYSELAYPELSCILVDTRGFGAHLARMIIGIIEKTEPEVLFANPTELGSMASVAAPYALNRKRIVSVGSINIDNYLGFDALPHSGTSASTTRSAVYPGGKCLNEAIGAARLGHAVAAIGRVGDDADSDVVFGMFSADGIDSHAVARTAGDRTGQAYIFVDNAGSSMISIMSGANSALSEGDVSAHEQVFRDVGICLLQTEVPMPAIERAAVLAKRYGATTILKPSDCRELPDDLLAHVDILVPNLDELSQICPDGASMEEKAGMLLSKSVSTVLVTMGGDGCCVFDRAGVTRIDALKVPSIDTTGAGDAFISALASYLLYGYGMVSAARIATYAASLSTLRQGVSPALVDRNTLEAYIALRDPSLLGA